MTFDEAAERVREQHRVVRNAIDACLGNDHVLPALMLLYAAIDAMGWLARPAGAEQSGEHFRDYVDRYVRKPTDEATAMDLWGARCGILHEQTPESNASRMGRAQMITYDLENGQSLVQIRIPGTKSLKMNPEGLVRKWAAGVERFLQDIAHDGTRHQEFIDRAESLVIQQHTQSPEFTTPPT